MLLMLTHTFSFTTTTTTALMQVGRGPRLLTAFIFMLMPLSTVSHLSVPL